MKAHYVILKDRVVLDTNTYKSWRDIQDAYPDYVSSLGPWTKEELLSYLEDDFKDEASWPLTRAEINSIYDT